MTIMCFYFHVYMNMHTYIYAYISLYIYNIASSFMNGHGFYVALGCALFLQQSRFDYCFGGKEFAAEGVIVEHEAEIATAEAAASESALQ